MPTRGMAAYHERAPKPRQLTRCRPHLLDNVVDGNTGAEVIAWNCDADLVGIQPSGEMAERGTVERLPVTPVNENDDRASIIAGKEINRIACTGTIRNRARGTPRAIGCRVSCPTGHNRGVLRNPRPVVVFDLVIDNRVQESQRPLFRGFLRGGFCLCQQTHQFADVLWGKVGKYVGDPGLMLRRHLAKLGAADFRQPDYLDAAVGLQGFSVEMGGLD